MVDPVEVPLTAINQLRRVTFLADVSASFVVAAVTHRNGCLKPRHKTGQVALRSINGQMHMVGHQAVFINVHSEALPALMYRLHEQALAIGFIENARTLITTHPYMVYRSRKVKPHRSCLSCKITNPKIMLRVHE